MTGITLSVALAVVVVVFFVIDFFFMLRYDRERQSGKGWAWDYTLLVGGLGLMVVLQPVLFPALGVSMVGRWGQLVQAVGILLILLSFIVHIWSRLHLQKYYAERVELQADHKIIDSGPYALVRHPLVTSFFMLASGVFLFAPALTTLVVVVYVYWDFIRAALQEEDLLGRNLPGYREYMQRVPRFFPRLKLGGRR